MKEQMIKRIIMEAGDDDTGKNVCMQMTFHGYAENEVSTTISEAEKFWEDVKERLHLKDVSESEKETVAPGCYQHLSHS